MARPLRVEFEGAIYHVTARGNDRRPIFLDDKDRLNFLERLRENVGTHAIRLYAYVLMDNHYHLLIETPRGNLSTFMQQLNTGYVSYYNYHHQRCGHLFEGRYKARLVEGDRYLLALVRYIHLNPVKVSRHAEKSVSEKQTVLHEYLWSSHRAYCGLSGREGYIDYEPLLLLVAAGEDDPEKAYVKYVENGLLAGDSELAEALGRSSKAIGGCQFCRWAENKYRERAENTGRMQDVSMRRIEVGVSPEIVISCVCSFFSIGVDCLKRKRNTHVSRVLAMKLLKECSGLSNRSVAEVLGMGDGSGVSRRISSLNLQIAEDRNIYRMYEKLKKGCLITNQGLTPYPEKKGA